MKYNISPPVGMKMLFAYCLLLTLMTLHATCSVPTFQEFDVVYNIQQSGLIPTYSLPDGVHVRGFIECTFPQNRLVGTYMMRNVPLDMLSTQHDPQIPRLLNLQAAFSVDMREIMWKDGVGEPSPGTNLTLRFLQQVTKNVDPYSIQIYRYYKEYDHLFRPSFKFIKWNSNQLVPSLGPVEIKIDILEIKTSKKFDNEYNFAIYANDNRRVATSEVVPLRFPRQIDFGDLSLTYNNVKVKSPDDNFPSVKLTAITNPVRKHPVYSIEKQFKIEELNIGNDILIEERSYSIKYDQPKSIEISSYTCGYSKNLTDEIRIDKGVSVIQISSTEYQLICRDMHVDASYMLYILVRPLYRRIEEFSAEFGDIQEYHPNVALNYDLPERYGSELITDTLKMSNIYTGHTYDNTNGQYVLNYLNPEPYSNIPIQGNVNLTLFHVIQVNVSSMVVPNDGSVNEFLFTFTNFHKEGIDPSSFRIGLISLDMKSFDLIETGNDLSIGMKYWSLNIPNTQILSSKTATYGFFYFAQQSFNLNEQYEITYSRTLPYKLSSSISMQLYYEMPFGLFESKPFVKVSQQTNVETIQNLGSFVVLQMLRISSGNELNTLNNLDTRKFIVKEPIVISGNRMKMQNLKCGYLFKESGYKSLEFSSAISYQSIENNGFIIDCKEDIKDDEYIVVLISTKESEKNTHDLSYRNSYNIQLFQRIISHFESPWTEEDVFMLDFSDYSTYEGTFSFLTLSKSNIDSYDKPQTISGLSLRGAFEMKMALHKIGNLIGKLFLQFIRKSQETNVDPKSFKLLKLNNDRSMEFINEDVISAGNWLMDYYPSLTPSFRFAVYANVLSPIASMGLKYDILFERSLSYQTSPGTSFLLYFIVNHPYQYAETPTYSMSVNTKSLSLTNYEIVQSFNVKSENLFSNGLNPVRRFIFNDNHVFYNTEGRMITDISSLRCAYLTPGSTDFQISSEPPVRYTKTTLNIFCKEIVVSNDYLLLIISLDKLPPLPKPSIIPNPPPTHSSLPVHSLQPIISSAHSSIEPSHTLQSTIYAGPSQSKGRESAIMLIVLISIFILMILMTGIIISVVIILIRKGILKRIAIEHNEEERMLVEYPEMKRFDNL